jgi:hypothetical protein
MVEMKSTPKKTGRSSKGHEMNPFRSFTLKWWQVSLFKIAMVSLGLALGATWPQFFARWLTWFWLVFLAAGAYITFVWYRQAGNDSRLR